jgi:hypothetical protein
MSDMRKRPEPRPSPDDAIGRREGALGTPGTRFRIGSMNKMCTAVATLQPVEAGSSALDSHPSSNAVAGRRE